MPQPEPILVRIIDGHRYHRRVSPYALVSSGEAAHFLGYGLRHLYRLIQDEALPVAIRRRNKISFRFIDILRLKQRRTKGEKTKQKGRLEGEFMATKNELMDRIAVMRALFEEVLSLAEEIKQRARDGLQEERDDSKTE
jgi:hypothetical protein